MNQDAQHEAEGGMNLLLWLLIGAALTFLYALCAGAITSDPEPYNFGITPQLLASLFYWPCFVFSISATCVAIWVLAGRRHLGMCSGIILLSVPMLIYGFHIPRYKYLKNYRDNQRMGSEAASEADQMNKLLLEYYYHHPNNFEYLGQDDQVDVEGFVDFVKSKQPLVAYGADGETDPIVIHGNAILSPVGEPLVFLLDRNHDGYLRYRDLKGTVNNFADPWTKNGYDGAKVFGYSCAVGTVIRACPQYLNDEAAKQPFYILPLNSTDYEFSNRPSK